MSAMLPIAVPINSWAVLVQIALRELQDNFPLHICPANDGERAVLTAIPGWWITGPSVTIAKISITVYDTDQPDDVPFIYIMSGIPLVPGEKQ